MKQNPQESTTLHRDVYFPLPRKDHGLGVWRVSRVDWNPGFAFQRDSFEPLFFGLVLRGKVLSGTDWVAPGGVLVAGNGSSRDHQSDPQSGADLLICVCSGNGVPPLCRELKLPLPGVLYPRYPQRLESLWDHLLTLGGDPPVSAPRLASLLAETLLREITAYPPGRITRAEAFFRKAQKAIWDTLDQRPTIDSLAADLGVSRTYLSRIFRERTGETPFRFQQRHQMARARDLLDEGYSVTDVAAKLHWPDLPTFSKAYRRITGRSPR
ncbi:MAG: AraC family transcriptional regulator [Opitutales bacterium]|nr:AraC family transcriptional regulator [Opitutales bacterium]